MAEHAPPETRPGRPSCPGCQARVPMAALHCPFCQAWLLEDIDPKRAEVVGLQFMLAELKALRAKGTLPPAALMRLEDGYRRRLDAALAADASFTPAQESDEHKEETPDVHSTNTTLLLPPVGQPAPLSVSSKAPLEDRLMPRPRPELPAIAQARFQVPDLQVRTDAVGLEWSALRPVVAENFLWFIGTFLTLVGAFYFTSTRWGSWSETTQALLILGILVVGAALFGGLGRFLVPRRGLEQAGRLMAVIGIALLPTAIFPLSSLLSRAPVVGGSALLGVAAWSWWILPRLSVVVSARHAAGFSSTFFPLALAPALRSVLELIPLGWALPYLELPFLAVALWRFNVGRKQSPQGRRFLLGLHFYGWGFSLLVNMNAAPISHYLPLIPFLGGALLYADLAESHWRGVLRPYLHQATGMLGLWSICAGAVLALFHAARTGDVATSTGTLLLATLGLVATAVVYRRRWPLWAAQTGLPVLLLLCQHLLPGLVGRLTDAALTLLGLSPVEGVTGLQRLLLPSFVVGESWVLPGASQAQPLVMLSVLLLPLVGLEFLLLRWLDRLERPALAADVRQIIAGLSVVLAGVSVIGTTSPRPALLVLPFLVVALYRLYRLEPLGHSILIANLMTALWLWSGLEALSVPLTVRALAVGGLGLIYFQAGWRFHARTPEPAVTRVWWHSGVGFSLLAPVLWALSLLGEPRALFLSAGALGGLGIVVLVIALRLETRLMVALALVCFGVTGALLYSDLGWTQNPRMLPWVAAGMAVAAGLVPVPVDGRWRPLPSAPDQDPPRIPPRGLLSEPLWWLASAFMLVTMLGTWANRLLYLVRSGLKLETSSTEALELLLGSLPSSAILIWICFRGPTSWGRGVGGFLALEAYALALWSHVCLAPSPAGAILLLAPALLASTLALGVSGLESADARRKTAWRALLHPLLVLGVVPTFYLLTQVGWPDRAGPEQLAQVAALLAWSLFSGPLLLTGLEMMLSLGLAAWLLEATLPFDTPGLGGALVGLVAAGASCAADRRWHFPLERGLQGVLSRALQVRSPLEADPELLVSRVIWKPLSTFSWLAGGGCVIFALARAGDASALPTFAVSALVLTLRLGRVWRAVWLSLLPAGFGIVVGLPIGTDLALLGACGLGLVLWARLAFPVRPRRLEAAEGDAPPADARPPLPALLSWSCWSMAGTSLAASLAGHEPWAAYTTFVSGAAAVSLLLTGTWRLIWLSVLPAWLGWLLGLPWQRELLLLLAGALGLTVWRFKPLSTRLFPEDEVDRAAEIWAGRQAALLSSMGLILALLQGGGLLDAAGPGLVAESATALVCLLLLIPPPERATLAALAPAMLAFAAQVPGPPVVALVSAGALVLGEAAHRRHRLTQEESPAWAEYSLRAAPWLAATGLLLTLTGLVPLLGLRGALGSPLLTFQLAVLAWGMLRDALRTNQRRSLFGGLAGIFLAGAGAIVWGGILLGRGRPEAALLPPLGLLASLLSTATLVGLWRGRLQAQRAALLTWTGLEQTLGVALAIGGLALLPDWSRADALMIIGAMGLVSLSAGLAAFELERPARLHLSALAGLLAAGAARAFGWLEPLPAAWDPYLLAVGGLVMLGTSEALKQQERTPLARPIYTWALLLPGLGLGLGLAMGELSVPLLGLVASVLLASQVFRPRPALLLAVAILYNAMLMKLWWENGWMDPQLYAVPVGLTAAFLAHHHRQSLGSGTLAVLRYGSLSLMYSICLLQSAVEPLNTLWLVGLCLGGVGSGIWLRVRSFLFLSTGFLVGAVGMNLIRFGLAHPNLNAVFLISLGLTILTGMVFFSWKRSQIISLRDRISRDLEDWD